MPTCHNCGGQIEFRYLGGGPIPIHVSGGWCSGYSSGPRAAAVKPFSAVTSYVNPNAQCPVCGERVYYYQSPHGGRVFFDNVGWPWPKHPCTDNPRSQHGPVKPLTQNVYTAFRNRQGEPLDLYQLDSLVEKAGVTHMRFGRLNENRSFSVSLKVGRLRDQEITTDDLRNAPSFVVQTYETHRTLEFISGRKKRIDTLTLPRSKP